jgi:hypothetical protein
MSSNGVNTTQLGVGYDCVTSSFRSRAVVGETAASGGESTVKLTVCQGSQEVAKELDIQQSLAISYLGYDVSEKADFAQSLQTTSQSVSIVMHSYHSEGKQTFLNPTFDTTIPGLMTNSTPTSSTIDTFVKGYGDQFIESFDVCGEYIAVYTFYTETSDQQSNLTASLKASGIFSGVDVSADIQTKIQQIQKESDTYMSFYQYVSGLKDQALPSVDNVIEYGMTTFPSIPLDAPKISNMTCRGYEGVPNMKLDFSQVVKNRKSFCDDDGAVFMATYQIGSLQAACQALKRVYARYGYNGDQTVDNQVNKDRETLISLYNAYEASPSFEIDFTSLPSLSLGTPTLTVTTNLYGPYGGGGGGPWDATVANPVLALNGGRRLKSLLI